LCRLPKLLEFLIREKDATALFLKYIPQFGIRDIDRLLAKMLVGLAARGFWSSSWWLLGR
jgi:hypothetical protein